MLRYITRIYCTLLKLPRICIAKLTFLSEFYIMYAQSSFSCGVCHANMPTVVIFSLKCLNYHLVYELSDHFAVLECCKLSERFHLC